MPDKRYGYSFTGSDSDRDTIKFHGNMRALQTFLKEHPEYECPYEKGATQTHSLRRIPSGVVYEYDNPHSTCPVRACTPTKTFIKIHFNKKPSEVSEADYIKIINQLNEGDIQFDELSRRASTSC